MPIKKVTFSFDVPITELLSLIAAGHAELKISVFGDQPKHSRLTNGSGQKLLSPPKKQPNMRRLMLAALLHAEDLTGSPELMRQATVKAGYSPKSASNQIFELTKRKLITRLERNRYRLTAQGAKLLREQANG